MVVLMRERFIHLLNSSDIYRAFTLCQALCSEEEGRKCHRSTEEGQSNQTGVGGPEETS